MSDPRKEILKKDPLDGLDINIEHELIIKGKSKLSRNKRDRVVLMKKIQDQQQVFIQSNAVMADERTKLKELIEEYRKL